MMDVLSSMNCPVVYDIIYQPGMTMLLFGAQLLQFPILNGIGMNLEQAVIAFEKATTTAGLRQPNQDEVRRLMSPVW